LSTEINIRYVGLVAQVDFLGKSQVCDSHAIEE